MSKLDLLCATLTLAASQLATAFAFEGRITTKVTRGGEAQTVHYTVGATQLRIERGETDRPHAKNIVNIETGAVTLVFPHNHSFVRLNPGAQGAAPAFAGALPMPMPPGGLPPGIGPRSTPSASAAPSTAGVVGVPGAPGLSALPTTPPLPTGIGPHTTPGTTPPLPTAPGAAGVPGALATPNVPALPPLPPGIGPTQSQPGIRPTSGTPLPGFGQGGITSNFPAMPMMPGEQVELKATGEKKEILGFPCTRYELKQRGEVMEIWATDKLLPFQPWQANQPLRFGPRRIEEKWGEMLKAKKLFPLSATLKFEHGPERLRFEVTSIKSEKISDPDGTYFRPPTDYHEIQSMPF